MPYGEGYTDDELEQIRQQYEATDDDATYEVTFPDGRMTITVSGINSAKAVAGRDGQYRKLDD